MNAASVGSLIFLAHAPTPIHALEIRQGRWIYCDKVFVKIYSSNFHPTEEDDPTEVHLIYAPSRTKIELLNHLSNSLLSRTPEYYITYLDSSLGKI